VAAFSFRSWALWLLGYAEAALAGAHCALKDAREIDQAVTTMHALGTPLPIHILCGNYAAANALLDEFVSLVDEKGALYWKAAGMLHRGSLFALRGNATDAVHMITSRLAAWRSTGATAGAPVT
jgi:hypothetical protein